MARADEKKPSGRGGASVSVAPTKDGSRFEEITVVSGKYQGRMVRVGRLSQDAAYFNLKPAKRDREAS